MNFVGLTIFNNFVRSFIIPGMEWKEIAKVLNAVELLSKPSGTTIAELQRGLGLSRRTVYRLLDVLQKMNFPIYDEKMQNERSKYWKMDESYISKLPNISIPDIGLTKLELFVLSFLFSSYGPFKATELEKHIESLKGKLGAYLQKNGNIPLTEEKLKYLFVPSDHFLKDYSGKQELIEDLLEAIIEQKTCTITYHAYSTDEINTFRIDPLRLFERNGGLYVFIRTTRYQSIRMIAVERIMDCTILDEAFQYPQDFNPEALLESAFQLTLDDPISVKIWFDKNQARYIKERKWSVKQEIEEKEDGSVVLNLSTSGVYDVMQWILSFGASAKILEPQFLKKDIQKKIMEMNRIYEES